MEYITYYIYIKYSSTKWLGSKSFIVSGNGEKYQVLCSGDILCTELRRFSWISGYEGLGRIIARIEGNKEEASDQEKWTVVAFLRGRKLFVGSLGAKWSRSSWLYLFNGGQKKSKSLAVHRELFPESFNCNILNSGGVIYFISKAHVSYYVGFRLFLIGLLWTISHKQKIHRIRQHSPSI